MSPRLHHTLLTGAGLVAALAALTTVGAQPPAPALFCEAYPDVPACSSGEAACTTCHTAVPALSAYGQDISEHLLPGEERPLHEDSFAAGLGDALVAVEELDSDGDGTLNLDELELGTDPGDASSAPRDAACVDQDGDGWNLCGYDVMYAYKKVMIDFCGRSPTLDEREDFLALGGTAIQLQDALHDVLDACLDSEHWRGRDGQVWNLANKKIGPLQAVKSGLDSGPIPLADYDDDYAYFVWTQTDERDARLVLTGQSFVSASYQDGRTVYTEWDRSAREDYDARGDDRYQAVRKEKRAGMVTHRWFLMVNTMFTAIPRTTAAQAYRSYLGYDIAALQGLYPVEDEPQDYDSKGVGAEDCAVCHSTLDPLSYPFSRYEGIGGGNASPYSYGANRLQGFTDVDGERVADTPEAGMILGEPVEDLVAWASVAANSEAFRRATVRDYWRLLVGEDPRADEQAEFGALVQDFGTTYAYNVELMLHGLIDTEAYGAP